MTNILKTKENKCKNIYILKWFHNLKNIFLIEIHQYGEGLGRTTTYRINQLMNEHKEGDVNQNLLIETNVLAINIQIVEVKVINVEYMEPRRCLNEECQISQLEVS